MVTQPYVGSGTIGTTEFSLPNNSTSLASINVSGVYQTFLNLRSLTPEESYKFLIKEKVTTSGAQQVLYERIFDGVHNYLDPMPAQPLFHGWDQTIQKLTGTDRFISWSIRQVT